MRVAFLGTDKIGITALKEIIESSHDVVLVITQPDRPKGRGKQIVPSEISLLTEAYRIPILQPESIKQPEVLEALETIKPDILAVVSYGQYIPRSIYEFPLYGSVNLHPSLLPRWRGAAPVQYALLNGDTVTGVTVQYVHKKMDAGDVLMQEETPVDPNDDHGSLCDKLYPQGAKMLIKVLDGLEAGTINAVPQDESKVTIASKIEKSDLWIDWSESAEKIRNRIRALAPLPGAKVKFHLKDFKILAASIESEICSVNNEPGVIVSISENGPVVSTGSGCLLISEIQPAGRNPQTGKDFLNGYKPATGDKFSSGLDEK